MSYSHNTPTLDDDLPPVIVRPSLRHLSPLNREAAAARAASDAPKQVAATRSRKLCVRIWQRHGCTIRDLAKH